jgi:hypothetical protein
MYSYCFIFVPGRDSEYQQIHGMSKVDHRVPRN